MRTTFVNPRRRSKKTRKSRKRRARRRNVRINSAPRRRSRNMQMNPRRRRRSRRGRRRNAGIRSFVGNPMILQNPRRRRARRNPGGMEKLSVKKVLNKTIKLGGGAVIGVGASVFALNKIENDWVRMGARWASAILASATLKGELGASTAGALLYPLVQELLVKLGIADDLGIVAADLPMLSADLGDMATPSALEDAFMSSIG